VLRSVSQSHSSYERGRSPGSEKTDRGSSTGKDEVRDQVEIKLVVYGTWCGFK
jgi:hypothetical protein